MILLTQKAFNTIVLDIMTLFLVINLFRPT